MESKRKLKDAHTTQKQQLEKLQKELEGNLNGWKRAVADYHNLKRETEEKLNAIGTYTQVKLFAEMMPIIDHVAQAVDHVPQNLRELDWVKGLTNIQKQFDEILRTYKIEKIKTVGEIFDPEVHQAVGSEHDKNKKDHEILKEAKAGYRIEDTILYPALVIVNNISEI